MTRQALVYGRTYLIDGEGSGLYHGDTRHLQVLRLELDGDRIGRIAAQRHGAAERTLLYAQSPATNQLDAPASQKRTGLIVRRHQTIAGEERFQETVTVANHTGSRFDGELCLGIAADFADIFEVRDSDIDPRTPETRIEGSTITFSHSFTTYDGAEEQYTTAVTPDRPPSSVDDGIGFDLTIPAGDEEQITVTTAIDGATADPKTHSALHRFDSTDPVLQQSYRDLEALTTVTPHGAVPLAGTPWFMTVFGRDACITAIECLHAFPELASGTLRYLATLQGEAHVEERLEEPGKMHHEIRHGELAAKRRIPFYRYYGAIDTTPLWVILLTEYYRQHNQEQLVNELENSLDAALDWIGRKMDSGDDQYIYYQQTDALEHQFWKDSSDSVQQHNGVTLDPPLAVAEVQGYAFRALQGAAKLVDAVLDRPGRADELRERASTLRDAFNEDFWLDERQFYALAKTPDGYYADTKASDIGQCLWTGIIEEDRAAAVIKDLVSEAFMTGHGIRTLSSEEQGYSPVSYHNGSIWPHDNALTALGFARYGFEEQAAELKTKVFDAARQHGNRLPEVFCGFEDLPVIYPSSCRPQAWAAAAPFALERAASGDVPQPPRDGRDGQATG